MIDDLALPRSSFPLPLSVWGPTVKHARLLIYFHAQKGTESPRSLPNPIAAPYHIISRPNEFQMMRQFFSLSFFLIFLVFVSSYSPSSFGSHSHFPAFARRPFFNCQNNFLLHFGAVCGWMTLTVCVCACVWVCPLSLGRGNALRYNCKGRGKFCGKLRVTSTQVDPKQKSAEYRKRH